MKSWLKAFSLVGILAVLLAGTYSSPEKKTFLVVNFDVEDYITPESEGIDAIPKWLAEIMSEEGVTGTFFVIGEKARSLEKRGRRDVVEAMARHDIGSHTNFGSIHPTVTEQLEKADWENGVSRMLEQESAGIRELERIFGVPVRTLGRHGGSYGPQLVCALGEMKAGYVGSPVSLPGTSVVWFCNALNFSGQYDGFDDFFYRDDLFEARFEKLKAELPALAGSVDVLSFFAGHPCKIRTEQFWDLNFYDGRNPIPSEWKTPELRPLESMITAQKNFRRLVRYLKSRDDFEITTFGSLMDLYSDQKELLNRGELRKIAERCLETRTLSPSEDISPAEAFAGLAQSLISSKEGGTLPKAVKVIHALGPPEMPDSGPGIARITAAEIFELARKANDHILRTCSLPSFLAAGNFRIGAGSLFALFSAFYLDLHSKIVRPDYEVPPFEPYPKTHEQEIIRQINGYKSWPVHRPDLDLSGIVELTKLQLWTLKPAHRK
jgi:peptidoglycan/xylan/chitin deacetylase (PgdA/CDA1 family)